MHRFSRRLPSELTPNRLTAMLAERERAGSTVLDLTLSNPTRAGFTYDEAGVLAALAPRAAMTYTPDPRGLPAARDAIAAYYAERGAAVAPDSICLTAGTSDGYAYLLKLLANPGDNVLVPRPTYPLLTMLGALEAVQTREYSVRRDGADGWRIELDSVAEAGDSRTRAVIVVAPHNPLGCRLRRSELAAISELCTTNGWALICDEVFADYVATTAAAGAETAAQAETHVITAAGNGDAPTFVLSGLSKIAGLPQVKLSWIQTSGPEDWRHVTQQRLDFVLDGYLAVGTPVQHAAAALLAGRHDVQSQIRARLDENEQRLRQLCGAQRAVRSLRRDGGWYAVLECREPIDEEDLVVSLLAEDGVLVHPGYFFDFERDGYLVISLLTPPVALAQGAALLLQRLN